MGHGTNIRKRDGGELKELVTGVLLEVKSVPGYGLGYAMFLDAGPVGCANISDGLHKPEERIQLGREKVRG